MRLIALLLFITSCNLDKEPSFREIIDENYTIQIMLLENVHNGMLAYKVRIKPNQKILEEAGKQLQQILWYKTDSCFYLAKGNIDLQPELVQPVANGQVNCYEYIVLFNNQAPFFGNNDNREFVFNDRHITREKYMIRL